MSLPDSLFQNTKRSLNNYLTKLIREWWYIRALINRRFSNAIFAKQSGNAIPSCVAWPNKARRIYYKNVPRGKFLFEIQHRDAYVGDERRSVVARFGFVTGTGHSRASLDFGLPRGSDGRLYAYMGSGRRRDDRFIQITSVNIPKFQKWMYVDVEVTVDRVVNLEKVRFFNKPVNPIDFQTGVGNWAIMNPGAASAKSLLYADIDVNVVDGSSVWLSSMASILCSLGHCVLVVKRDVTSDIILSNIVHRENLFVLGPEELGVPGHALKVPEAIQVLKALDETLPRIQHVSVRGTDAAAELVATRQFYGRSVVYLTDFYKLGDEGLSISAEREAQIKLIASQAAVVLTQTESIAKKLREIAPLPFRQASLPPVIPNDLPQINQRWLNGLSKPLKIGYSGKINPQWGVVELLNWTEKARSDGFDIELHIVANKISETAGGNGYQGFRNELISRMKVLGAQHHQTLNRELSMQLMSKMDFVWCWRPAILEDNTLELSTKLVEMAGSGARCLCYPSEVNQTLLGAEYPFFLRNYHDFVEVLPSLKSPAPAIGQEIRSEHSLVNVRDRLAHRVFTDKQKDRPRRIVFAGHDMKFVQPYMSYLKTSGHEVVRDTWGWGEAVNLDRSKRQQEWADIIFCEWGLANAVWHSANYLPGKKVYIRVHLQEIGNRARKLVSQINVGNIERVIFVSERVRNEAVALYGWPIDKTMVIPNFTLPDEYRFTERSFDGEIRLGMVGVIPQRKRLDRAVDLLGELLRRGHDASLHIKGPRPETIDFMHGPSRSAELDYYFELYRRIESDPLMANRVTYYPWGNDVAVWYQGIDHILSPSEFESFHYALADGVLAGCHPVVWPWDEANALYTSNWVVEDVAAAAVRIEAFRALPREMQQYELSGNRTLVTARYGNNDVFQQLDKALDL